jgi:plastocyanin
MTDAPGAIDWHAIAAGKAWKYTVRKSGEFTCICMLHPNMKGTLTVE